MNYIEQKSCGKRDLSLFGAFSANETITFAVSAHEPVSAVSMVIHGDGWGRETSVWHTYPLTATGGNTFQLTLSMKELCQMLSMDEGGLFYYHYRIQTDGDVLLMGGEEPEHLTPVVGGQGERQLLVYAEDYRSPEHTGGIMYHIFVDRFAKTGTSFQNQKPGTVMDTDWEQGIPQYGAYPGAEVANNVFFGGDLYGIAEHLDHIASLGTSILYLSPIFDAASNHKYDTADYLSVDAMFGGDEALAYLCCEAKKYGIRVILDGVFNHTGSDSIYFNKEGHYNAVGAYQSKDSPYADWYSFRAFPDDYECWWGVKILPRVRSGNAEYQRFIFENVIPKWREMGVYGWRLDVADELDEGFLNGFRKALRQNDDGFPIVDGLLIGEVWEDASDKVSYGERRQYLCGRQLDGVMNYPLREAVIRYIVDGDVNALRSGTERLYRRYPKWASEHCMNLLSTHDTVRILTALGGEPMGAHTNAELAKMRMTPQERQTGKKRLKLAYGLLSALPGIPCVFYGDEVGLEGYRDPFCRRPFPWQDMDADLLHFYQKVGMCRKKEPVLSTGDLRLLTVTPELLVFQRTLENARITVYLNRGDEPLMVETAEDRWELLTDQPWQAGAHRLAPGEVVWTKNKV